jgi:hypothetical protein
MLYTEGCSSSDAQAIGIITNIKAKKTISKLGLLSTDEKITWSWLHGKSVSFPTLLPARKLETILAIPFLPELEAILEMIQDSPLEERGKEVLSLSLLDIDRSPLRCRFENPPFNTFNSLKFFCRE